MKITLQAPVEREIELADLVVDLERMRRRAARPFSQQSLHFIDALSQELRSNRDARAFPELQALAFHIRKSELARLKQEFSALSTADTVLASRGLAFHIPPSNVPALFVYSWLYAFAAGNANVIRLPSRACAQTAILCAAFRRLLRRPAFRSLGGSLRLLSYEHADEATAAISLRADIRVLWGGDDTVQRLRALPLKPLARELAFGDRYSLSVLEARSYLASSARQRQDLAAKFYNDCYYFHQQACSSPRLVVWRAAAAQAERAGELFFAALQAEIRRKGFLLDAGAALKKLSFVYCAALCEPAIKHRSYGNELTVLSLGALKRLRRVHCGWGLFYEARIARFDELAGFVCEKDQTLTHFGFSAAEIADFSRSLDGRGLNRIVPCGQALTFGRYWDGYDLLQEMTQRIYVAPRVAT